MTTDQKLLDKVDELNARHKLLAHAAKIDGERYRIPSRKRILEEARIEIEQDEIFDEADREIPRLKEEAASSFNPLDIRLSSGKTLRESTREEVIAEAVRLRGV